MHDIAHLKNRLQSLSDCFERPMFLQKHPPDRQRHSLHQLLKQFGHEETANDIRRSLEAAGAQLELGNCPIIAVLGELNAGKSSVVAGFLSEDGKKRLPRGVHTEKGTHRFVYWVPGKWLANDVIRERFFKLLESAHGNRREFLSRDPSEAAEQYRSGYKDPDRLQIPLIAEDSKLEEIGAALRDCPDVQTRENPRAGRRPANRRLEFLADAARLCSAFLLVWERSKVLDGLLATVLEQIRERMPEAPLALLLNRVQPESGQPTETRCDPAVDELLSRYHISDRRFYVAFDFLIYRRGDHPGWEELTPPELVRHFDVDDGLPQFFHVDKVAGNNAPDSIEADRFLANLPAQLDAGGLQAEAVSSHCNETAERLRTALERIKREIQARRQRTEAFHRELLKFCNGLFKWRDNDEPVQAATSEFIEAFDASMRRTCPWYLRPSLKINSIVNKTGEYLKAVKAGRNVVNMPASQVKELRSQVSRMNPSHNSTESNLTTMTESDLADQTLSHRWWPDDLQDRETVERGWRSVLNAYGKLPDQSAPEEYDKMTSDYWRNMSGGQKLFKAFSGISTVLLLKAAVVLAIIDAGATMFVAYPMAATLAAKITGGITLTVGAIGTGAAFAGFLGGLVDLNTLPYLANFFLTACDVFGCPRKLGRELRVEFGRGGNRRQFTLPRLNAPKAETVCRSSSLQLWEILPACEEMRRTLDDDTQRQ